MLNYTKGEWKVSGAKNRVVTTQGGYIIPIAKMEAPEREDREANAQLIAAAPIGYELAEAVIDATFDDYDDFLALKEIAKKLKAKAKGR